MPLETLLSTPLLEPLPGHAVAAILSLPPFHPVPGLINARWLPLPIRPHWIFRSGAVNHLTPQGKNLLVKLGITTIFDLRSLKERTSEPDPDIESIDCKWEPSTLDNDTTASSQTQQQDAKSFSVRQILLEPHFLTDIHSSSPRCTLRCLIRIKMASSLSSSTSAIIQTALCSSTARVGAKSRLKIHRLHSSFDYTAYC